MIGLLLGIPLGVLSSLFAWWILFHLIVPKIEFSKKISKSKLDNNPSGYRYAVKMKNSGRRSIIDLELIARLRIRGLKPEYPNNWHPIDIPMAFNRVPELLPVKKRQFLLVVEFRIADIDAYSQSLLPNKLSTKVEAETILLEEVMSTGLESNLQVFLFGYDEFSGTRKVFASKKFLVDDISSGKFEKNTLNISIQRDIS